LILMMAATSRIARSQRLEVHRLRRPAVPYCDYCWYGICLNSLSSLHSTVFNWSRRERSQ
jgi:hypothetical protein